MKSLKQKSQFKLVLSPLFLALLTALFSLATITACSQGQGKQPAIDDKTEIAAATNTNKEREDREGSTLERRGSDSERAAPRVDPDAGNGEAYTGRDIESGDDERKPAAVAGGKAGNKNAASGDDKMESGHQ